MKASPATLHRALSMIDLFGTPDAAIHECDVCLTAIRPFTDRYLSAVRDLLQYFVARPDQLTRARQLDTTKGPTL